MYPRTYFETFMRYEAKDQVFVAMPFTGPFRKAFETVIEPAVRRVSVNGRPLSARIINRATSGAPDIHEQIFDAVLHSRLVIADMTVQSTCVVDDGSSRWQANANVTYEVGLASAWRNPEDILLIHQSHSGHTYGFDVQNLRHVQYEPDSAASIALLTDEIVRALNQSTFLAQAAYQKLVESVSPSAAQFMHQEAARAFPVIAFQSPDLGVMDARVHAITELLNYGALKNRNVVPQGPGKGVAIIYGWSEFGIRILQSLHAITPERAGDLRKQIASVAAGEIPPASLRDLPVVKATGEQPIDMVEAARGEGSPEVAQKQ